MKIAIIGQGAIAGYVAGALEKQGLSVAAYLLRPARVAAAPVAGPAIVGSAGELPQTDVVIDCAGHAALREHGATILRSGTDLLTVSIGALADADLSRQLEHAAQAGNARLHLASGAIGALDCLRAARVGTLRMVRYTGRKPPRGWAGSAAEDRLDLAALTGPETHFAGSARRAALDYPKNANVAAAVALAGLGFDDTETELIADPGIRENVHEIRAEGDFGSFDFRVTGATLPDNPRSSALAAMSVVSAIRDRIDAVGF